MTLAEQQTYWRRQLSGLTTAATLPADRERPPAPSYFRETASRGALPELWAQLRQRAAGWGTSPEVVVLAALHAVLHRYTGTTDLALGWMPDAAIAPHQDNLAVLRASLADDPSAEELVRRISETAKEAIAYGGRPWSAVQAAAAPATTDPDAPLFRVAFGLTSAPSAGNGKPASDGPWAKCAAELARCDLVLRAQENEGAGTWECDFDAELFDTPTIERFLEHLETLLTGLLREPGRRLADLPLLTPGERDQLLVRWNDTRRELPPENCLHHALEAQVKRTPSAMAVAFRNQQLTYRELNARANQWAHHLRRLGVGPGALVGICVERSLEMMVGLLGILKAGAAYVPLDPAYPRERLAFMCRDAQLRALLTQQHLAGDLPEHSAPVLCLDAPSPECRAEPVEDPPGHATANDLAYVMYTSGSTGRPKGVMVSHRNVLNFFAGMDQLIGSDGPGVWLAVTSISFDISVLELFWTLARGFTVVLYKEEPRQADRAASGTAERTKKIDFSLLYFASEAGQDAGDRYRLLLEGAKFADQHGFDAVWTPERHFHAFGGLYPNPSVTSAAVAAVTERIHIRAGSVVLPLQNPIRVAEEWSVVDNLSHGRAAISFASGWQINDFVLAPANYAARKDVMFRDIETVRRLWRGETLLFPGADGKPVAVKIWPPPVQRDLPIWITATGNPETCRAAGQLGANLLTHLIGQKLEDLAEKIRLYRAAWREAGQAGDGRVTLMLHTFVGDDLERVRETVREPFCRYLRSSVDLLKNSPWGFAPARLSSRAQVKHRSAAGADLTEDELAGLLEHAFDGYFKNSSLFGTPDLCLRMVERLQAIGVDEIACLIDFGVEAQAVLASLPRLEEVRARTQENAASAPVTDFSLAALANQYGVTHFQCTASLAGLLASEAENRPWLGRLRRLFIGGEAFPTALAHQLKQWVSGRIHNMYGPTETTVWSTIATLAEVNGTVPIGRPIANTQVYVLDSRLQPVPVGVAGELCIGGTGVARGYLNRPEVTAEKFLVNPFATDPESRLYRTGDRARYRPDGTLEFLGRLDHQVKIRGHRIELAEIEAILGQQESVRECAVIACQDAPGDQRLAAYVVPRTGSQAQPKTLRQFLRASLPEYMVPGVFVLLDQMPHTPNGKIDRRALPAPNGAAAAEIAPFIAPRNPVEADVARIWAELLGVERVSVEDNFFELGGHSLLAMRLITRLREVFRTQLPLGILFENPTVAGLAEALQALGWLSHAHPQPAPALERVEIEV